jgi:hypothetical protein
VTHPLSHAVRGDSLRVVDLWCLSCQIVFNDREQLKRNRFDTAYARSPQQSALNASIHDRIELGLIDSDGNAERGEIVGGTIPRGDEELFKDGLCDHSIAGSTFVHCGQSLYELRT